MSDKNTKAKTPAKSKPKTKKLTRTLTVKKENKSVSHFLQENGVSPEQAIRILEKTPAEFIYERPAKGGGKWQYVTGGYVKQTLNFVFAYNWDFFIDKQEEKYGQVVTLGRLVVKDKNGNTITKTQVGKADIKFKKGTKDALDYGNDCKASATDCLKKCASEFGIASDIYGQNEYKQEAEEITFTEVEEKYYDVAKNLINTAKSKATLEAVKNQLENNDDNFTVTEKKELVDLVDEKLKAYES